MVVVWNHRWRAWVAMLGNKDAPRVCAQYQISQELWACYIFHSGGGEWVMVTQGRWRTCEWKRASQEKILKDPVQLTVIKICGWHQRSHGKTSPEKWLWSVWKNLSDWNHNWFGQNGFPFVIFQNYDSVRLIEKYSTMNSPSAELEKPCGSKR